MKRAPLLIPLLMTLVLTGAGCGTSDTIVYPPVQLETLPIPVTERHVDWKEPSVLSAEEIQNKQVRITTEKGDIVIELYDATAPLTVSNFVYLAEHEFYNNLTFHRREEGFVIQGGDPSGNGTGGPGYTFADEFGTDARWEPLPADNPVQQQTTSRGGPQLYWYHRGTVAMANRGPDTNGSQFFIMLADVPLPEAYTIFGRVTEGMDVVDQIQVGDKMTTVTVEDKASQ